MGFSTDAKDFMLDNGAAAEITHVSLHIADPGDTGTDEVTGGTPAYSRESVTWGSSSGGIITASNQPVFDVPGGTTVRYVGFWDAATTGVFWGSEQVSDQIYSDQGTLTITSLTANLNEES